MERKCSKQYLVVFLVEGEKFKLRNLPRGLYPRTRSGHCLNSQHFIGVPTVHVAQLLPSGFFSPQPWFLRCSNQLFPGKTPACSINERRIRTGGRPHKKNWTWRELATSIDQLVWYPTKRPFKSLVKTTRIHAKGDHARVREEVKFTVHIRGLMFVDIVL